MTTLNLKSLSHVDGWMGNVQKVCTKLLSLPDNAKKTSFFSASAKIKICTLSKAPPPVWQHHQHMHKTSKYFMYRFVLEPLQFQSTGQNTHLNSRTVILPVLASTHLHSSQPKLSPVSESSTHSLQNNVCFSLLTSRPGSYAHKPTPWHWP